MGSVEDEIRRAMEDGKFDNLPGKGKPLRLDGEEQPGSDLWMAHHILKTGGYTLPWIEKRKEIEALFERARAALARAWEMRQADAPESRGEVRWRQAEERFREQVSALNRKVFTYNLEAPHERLQMAAYQAEVEIQKIQERL